MRLSPQMMNDSLMGDGQASAPITPLTVNGWKIYAHPVFIKQVENLISEVLKRKQKDPDTWQQKNCAKRLKAIFKLISEDIPNDPQGSQFQQGNTLGSAGTHWFRAKFFQQYRLFFRFDSNAKVILLAWVNDEKTLRAYDSKSDAYTVFQKMFTNGTPPNNFDDLLAECLKAQKDFEDTLKKNPEE